MSTTTGVGVLGWGILPLAILCVLPLAKVGWRDQGPGIAAYRIPDRQLTLLTGTDTGINRCKRPGGTYGCPGKSCGTIENAICVTCTQDPPLWNEECSTSGTFEQCTMLQLTWCADANIMGAKGWCSSGVCIPYSPYVPMGCGVFATCSPM